MTNDGLFKEVWFRIEKFTFIKLLRTLFLKFGTIHVCKRYLLQNKTLFEELIEKN